MEPVSPLQMNTSSFPSLLASSRGAPKLSFPRLKSLDWSCMLLVEGLQVGAGRSLVFQFLQFCSSCSGPTGQTPCQGPGVGQSGHLQPPSQQGTPHAAGQPKGGPQCEKHSVKQWGSSPSGSLEDYTVGARKGLTPGT